MEKEEFASIRKRLGKTQAQMAQLLGCSIKAVQSFEQGYRKVPVYAERQVLFLLVNKEAATKEHPRCWEALDCPPEKKTLCPAWEFGLGHLCWFINGTICKGRPQQSWKKKMAMCRECQVFQSVISL